MFKINLEAQRGPGGDSGRKQRNSSTPEEPSGASPEDPCRGGRPQTYSLEPPVPRRAAIPPTQEKLPT